MKFLVVVDAFFFFALPDFPVFSEVNFLILDETKSFPLDVKIQFNP